MNRMQYCLKLENTENSLDVQAQKIGWINYNTYTHMHNALCQSLRILKEYNKNCEEKVSVVT